MTSRHDLQCCKGALTLRPRHTFLQPRDQDLMNFGSRDQTPRPGQLDATASMQQAGGGHDQENAERGRREEFQGNLCFFPWPLAVRRGVLFSWC